MILAQVFFFLGSLSLCAPELMLQNTATWDWPIRSGGEHQGLHGRGVVSGADRILIGWLDAHSSLLAEAARGPAGFYRVPERIFSVYKARIFIL